MAVAGDVVSPSKPGLYTPKKSFTKPKTVITEIRFKENTNNNKGVLKI